MRSTTDIAKQIAHNAMEQAGKDYDREGMVQYAAGLVAGVVSFATKHGYDDEVRQALWDHYQINIEPTE